MRHSQTERHLPTLSEASLKPSTSLVVIILLEGRLTLLTLESSSQGTLKGLSRMSFNINIFIDFPFLRNFLVDVLVDDIARTFALKPLNNNIEDAFYCCLGWHGCNEYKQHNERKRKRINRLACLPLFVSSSSIIPLFLFRISFAFLLASLLA